jgi:hypothetical protein
VSVVHSSVAPRPQNCHGYNKATAKNDCRILRITRLSNTFRPRTGHLDTRVTHEHEAIEQVVE